MSYHLTDIPRGVYGEISKIQEELDEVKDASRQGINLMVLQELSDLIGAVEGYLISHYPYTSLQDLIDMSRVTNRAFESGHRK